MTYAQSVQIAQSGTQPLGMNKQTWLRHKQIAEDSRLSAISPGKLPKSFSALYELSKMPTELIDRLEKTGILGDDTASRILKRVRLEGKIEIWSRFDIELSKFEEFFKKVDQLTDSLKA